MTTNSLPDLIENFMIFDDWEERYRYLIDLGRSLPPMAEDAKTDEKIVRGCTSRVWLDAKVENGQLHFVADSDAHIVRGLIAVLMAAYQDQPVEKIAKIDIKDAFAKMGLDQNLSPNRRSGFFAMVERIQFLASSEVA